MHVNAPGWQIDCWNLAKARTAFAVEGFSEQNRVFFDELRVAYQYDMETTPTAIIFTPQDSK